MTSDLLKTKNYEIFKKHESNRAIDSSNIKKIKSSIEFKNLLEFRPILVDDDLKILDGQHRLEAAKQLGIEIYYKIQKQSEPSDILILNVNQKAWKIEDYLDYYISLGNEDYKKIRDFIVKNKLQTRNALTLLFGVGSSIYHVFRKGKCKFPDFENLKKATLLLDKLNEVLDIIKESKIDGAFFCNSSNFKKSLIDFLSSEKTEFEILKHKIKNDISKITKRQNCLDYYLMLKEIYNFRNKDPI